MIFIYQRTQQYIKCFIVPTNGYRCCWERYFLHPVVKSGPRTKSNHFRTHTQVTSGDPFPPTSSPAQTHAQHKQLSVNVELPIGTTLDDVSVLLPFSGSACPRSLGLFFPLPPLRRSTTPGQRRKRYGNFKITDAVLLKKEEKSSWELELIKEHPNWERQTFNWLHSSVLLSPPNSICQKCRVCNREAAPETKTHCKQRWVDPQWVTVTFQRRPSQFPQKLTDQYDTKGCLLTFCKNHTGDVWSLNVRREARLWPRNICTGSDPASHFLGFMFYSFRPTPERGRGEAMLGIRPVFPNQTTALPYFH